ncbi:MAG: hypothetical protein NTU95_03410 [Methanothrix sp.]|nr:hypothetical protein [Methanothrix sp.]
MAVKTELPIVLFCLLMLSQACSAASGTREDPIPIGTAADIGGGWSIKVLEVYSNANDMVAQENPFNSPPKDGQQFFLARIELKYTGPDSSEFAAGYRLRTVGPSSVVYSTYRNSPGVIPDELDKAEAFTGGSVIGNIGWAINSSDADELVMYNSYESKGDRKFMALYKII